MTIKVRRAEREDAKKLFALARQYTTGREPITYEEFSVALDNVLRYRDHETNLAFVATKNDDVVGYTLTTISRLLHASGLTAHLQEIVVDVDHRGQGVGNTLIRAIQTYCVARGVKQLSASTARFGSFFHQSGFVPVGEHFSKVLDLE